MVDISWPWVITSVVILGGGTALYVFYLKPKRQGEEAVDFVDKEIIADPIRGGEGGAGRLPKEMRERFKKLVRGTTEAQDGDTNNAGIGAGIVFRHKDSRYIDLGREMRFFKSPGPNTKLFFDSRWKDPAKENEIYLLDAQGQRTIHEWTLRLHLDGLYSIQGYERTAGSKDSPNKSLKPVFLTFPGEPGYPSAY